jgi:hypothetical protein
MMKPILPSDIDEALPLHTARIVSVVSFVSFVSLVSDVSECCTHIIASMDYLYHPQALWLSFAVAVSVVIVVAVAIPVIV